MRRLRGVALVFVFLFGGVSRAGAQDGERYFPETGHALDPRFAEYFDSHGGLGLLGYPITDAFTDPNGILVQYLQNARIEYVFDLAAGRMTPALAPLGERMGGGELKLRPPTFPMNIRPGCRFFESSGHWVCYQFLEFYESHGGPALFGYPISEEKVENRRRVQYFQGFRLDWYPEAPLGRQIKVAPLGYLHFRAEGLNPDLLQAREPLDFNDYRVTQLRLRSTVGQPIADGSGEQEVFLLVLDQNLKPVAGAAVTLVARFPDGVRTLLLPPTDAGGLTRGLLPFAGLAPGTLVRLEFWAVIDELEATTRDSFLSWW